MALRKIIGGVGYLESYYSLFIVNYSLFFNPTRKTAVFSRPLAKGTGSRQLRILNLELRFFSTSEGSAKLV